MQIDRQMVAPVAPEVIFAHVDDLVAYEPWMSLIHEVEPVDGEPGGNPAWSVELRAQVGPFARSKRLRMERTMLVPNERAVFERREADGRTHSAWILRADVAQLDSPDDSPSSSLTMRLSYGGSLWAGPVLERVLDDQVRRASKRLLELVT